MATMNISLPDKMKEWVERQTEDGSYSNASDYVRDLIRKDQERNRMYEEFRDLGREGLASGRSERTPEQIRDAVKSRLKSSAKRVAV